MIFYWCRLLTITVSDIIFVTIYSFGHFCLIRAYLPEWYLCVHYSSVLFFIYKGGRCDNLVCSPLLLSSSLCAVIMEGTRFRQICENRAYLPENHTFSGKFAWIQANLPEGYYCHVSQSTRKQSLPQQRVAAIKSM